MVDYDRDTVAICMAAFNGERYIKEQIESILMQTFRNWILFIRDDGSTDRTREIIDQYCRKHPDRIIGIKGTARVGSTGNFALIRSYVTRHYSFNYYMFADQDDIWLPDKIRWTMKAMKAAEERWGGPVLVHTDMKVVDEELRILGDSFFTYRSLDPARKTLNHLLVENNITGSTVMWNRQLNTIMNGMLKRSDGDMTGGALMHPDVYQQDWWLGLIACCFGRIVCVRRPTVLYRQHKDNLIGAEKVNSLGHILYRLLISNSVKKSMIRSVKQSRAFYYCYQDKLTGKQKTILQDYMKLYQKGKLFRVFSVIRRRYLKHGLVQLMGELMFI